MRLTAAEAAARLGVKRETLYAYVSRGMLTSERVARESTFDADEVAALAARTRRGGRAGGLELIVATSLTHLSDDHLAYRGHDVADLVPHTSFESVAELLWTGSSRAEPWPFGAGFNAPPGAHPIDQLRILVALAADDLRYDLAPASVAAAGRRAIASMVSGLPGPLPIGTSIAARLVPRLHPHRPFDELEPLVNAALVLLADHELAASTLAARIAASVRADPYSVISTGLGVIAGGLHGAASQPVAELLDEIGTAGRIERVVGEHLRRGLPLPGLGHKVYVAHDPRTELLLELIRPLDLPRWEVVERVLELWRERGLVNVDFALGALGWATGMDPTAGEVVFAVARSAGWIAHAIEEYGEKPLRFRPRAVYTGPTEGAQAGRRDS